MGPPVRVLHFAVDRAPRSSGTWQSSSSCDGLVSPMYPFCAYPGFIHSGNTYRQQRENYRRSLPTWQASTKQLTHRTAISSSGRWFFTFFPFIHIHDLKRVSLFLSSFKGARCHYFPSPLSRIPLRFSSSSFHAVLSRAR